MYHSDSKLAREQLKELRRNRRRLRRQRRRRNPGILRKIVVLACMLAAAWILIGLFLSTPDGQIVLEAVTPWYQNITAIINDPLGVDWAGHVVSAAALFFAHISIIAMLIDEL